MKTKYIQVRENSKLICCELSESELSFQPTTEVSPPKWHLGHTTWFFEKMILEKFVKNYKCFNSDYDFIFNSYYKQIGKHLNQADRGAIKIDSAEILEYREYVDKKMLTLFDGVVTKEISELIIVGLNHEEQHQELLHMDIKAVLFSLKKKYPLAIQQDNKNKQPWLEIAEGIIECGNSCNEFSFDNERPRHKHYQYKAMIASALVTNAEYSDFIKNDGYTNSKYWLSKGWDWVKENNISCPLYWENQSGPMDPVSHISYFEADAYANWAGYRLPTEFEHEYFDEVNRSPSVLWGWTSSQYSPYPGFQKFDGSLFEYNGKFMCNQFVLRGGCSATAEKHWRTSYRNFYEPHQRWMFSGIRLAKDI
jgi:ergothioneine biosynthesis protein EgtB